jgi:hypothetical protein
MAAKPARPVVPFLPTEVVVPRRLPSRGLAAPSWQPRGPPGWCKGDLETGDLGLGSGQEMSWEGRSSPQHGGCSRGRSRGHPGLVTMRGSLRPNPESRTCAKGDTHRGPGSQWRTSHRRPYPPHAAELFVAQGADGASGRCPCWRKYSVTCAGVGRNAWCSAFVLCRAAAAHQAPKEPQGSTGPQREVCFGPTHRDVWQPACPEPCTRAKGHFTRSRW